VEHHGFRSSNKLLVEVAITATTMGQNVQPPKQADESSLMKHARQ